MTKRLSSKQKVYTQTGINIWGKGPFLWKNNTKDKWKNTPGEHKKKHKLLERYSPMIRGDSINEMNQLGYLIPKSKNEVKISYYEPRYASQLKEKQKLRKFYANVTEKQFYNYYVKAKSFKGKIGDNLIKMLERRLDIIIYRAGFVNSIYQARLLVNHKHVLVNNKIQNISSYLVQNGDMISIKPEIVNLLRNQYNWDILQKSNGSFLKYLPYLEVDYKTMSCIYLYTPEMNEIYFPFQLDMNKVIRYYV
uniref:Small ribosomal subunit protein uS4m n=1 Tax=Reclinomonas americana TaxID=48483 RepID=RT04_RECAM|nr:ribosomal protein S4 [Reclinomonas americana]O21263.1 RecName: Full=Small ribosomal subunit protein uS4m; AltName: Full=Ribosomal protein S4, mitochondrial [Reclinomonas americana]AAD11890.1 ribosomal protein S4 [Reclinomonas americana]